jgi:hypothetical protein
MFVHGVPGATPYTRGMDQHQERPEGPYLGRVVSSIAAAGLITFATLAETGRHSPHIEALIQPAPSIRAASVMVTGSFTPSIATGASGGWRIKGWSGSLQRPRE